MKLAVTRCDGNTEIIVLNDPVRVTDGPGQACIRSAEGMEHFFRLADGKYDGWGYGGPGNGMSFEQAQTYLKAIQSQRKIIPLSVARILQERLRRFLKENRLRIAYLNWQARRKSAEIMEKL